MTAERPVVAQYEPAGHAVQVVDPVEAWYDPVRHFEQIDADAAE